ncbi:hypothetical protein LSTR_LSTR003796 [Laodelphax striatellus]|uniref:Uncharacterized protein n=1 Tax=Laodelphax striatellus TaxID=195883 RepID=A0A482XEC3_LAOST|nr:hypothetical protein LSTR_LSTR003796 [Laodelphax striatellus]
MISMELTPMHHHGHGTLAMGPHHIEQIQIPQHQQALMHHALLQDEPKKKHLSLPIRIVLNFVLPANRIGCLGEIIDFISDYNQNQGWIGKSL